MLQTYGSGDTERAERMNVAIRERHPLPSNLEKPDVSKPEWEWLKKFLSDEEIIEYGGTVPPVVLAPGRHAAGSAAGPARPRQ